MSLVYRLLYLVGFSPWDTGQVPTELSALVEGGDALPAGRALDIGCGTGTQAVYLARQGWRVTGVDAVERPLRRARVRAAANGVAVDWIRADVTRLVELGLSPGFALVFDRGCYHGLSDQERDAYAAAVTALAAPGATLLMMAFAPNRVLVGPSGADEADIVARFTGWRLDSMQADGSSAPAGPLRNVPRRWYRLRRG
jgi:SAM-dependent methyltransferase